jgi:hypothetical protein
MGVAEGEGEEEVALEDTMEMTRVSKTELYSEQTTTRRTPE